VAQPTAASAAISQAAPNSSDDGCDGWFCGVKHAASGVGSAVADVGGAVGSKAAEVASSCAQSANCSGTVLVGFGMAITPVSGGAGTVFIAAGVSRMAVSDAQGCAGGDGLSCGMLVVDAAAGYSTAAHALGLSGGLGAPVRRTLATEVDRGTLQPVDWVGRSLARSAVSGLNAYHRSNLEHSNWTTGVPIAVGDSMAAVRALR
jgi:hypothetical protein